MAGTKTRKQVRYLLGPNSPLSPLEREKLRRELREGKVRVVEDLQEKRKLESRA